MEYVSCIINKIPSDKTKNVISNRLVHLPERSNEWLKEANRNDVYETLYDFFDDDENLMLTCNLN